ncbi:MAG: hypothetical protein LBI64_03055 [Coriobacteriales bacterium]|jgi:transcriptional regulator with XRE-family HTH domain|nr:hypothetical protein [Coriobacteriales bacterium]
MIRLIQERTKLGFSQAKLSRIADLNTSTVCCIERGEMRSWLAQKRKLADAPSWQGEPDDLFEEAK